LVFFMVMIISANHGEMREIFPVSAGWPAGFHAGVASCGR
jgi:hypothetical protein